MPTERGSFRRRVFRLSVAAAPVNHEPVLSSPLADAAGKAGEDFSYVLAAGAFSDPDGQAMIASQSLVGVSPAVAAGQRHHPYHPWMSDEAGV